MYTVFVVVFVELSLGEAWGLAANGRLSRSKMPDGTSGAIMSFARRRGASRDLLPEDGSGIVIY